MLSPELLKIKVTEKPIDQSMHEHKQDATNFFNAESVLPLSIS